TTEKPREPALAEVFHPTTADTAGRSAKRTIRVTSVMAVLAGLCVLLIYTQRKSHATAAGRVFATSMAASEASLVSSNAPQVDAVARELYLQGRYHWDKRT